MYLDRKKEKCLIEELLFLLGVIEWEYKSPNHLVYKEICIYHDNVYGEIKLTRPIELNFRFWQRSRLRRAVNKHIDVMCKFKDRQELEKKTKIISETIIDLNKC